MLKEAFIFFWLLWASGFRGVQPGKMEASSISWKPMNVENQSNGISDLREPEEPMAFYCRSHF